MKRSEKKNLVIVSLLLLAGLLLGGTSDYKEAKLMSESDGEYVTIFDENK